uniref:Uncharacterized protein n=1 Tax=Triticum urartu TaxID=4572 RepID=A0A8R7VAS1_TRIUA
MRTIVPNLNLLAQPTTEPRQPPILYSAVPPPRRGREGGRERGSGKRDQEYTSTN